MKAITDDQVISLMQSLRKRERRALKALAEDVHQRPETPGPSARLYRFVKGVDGGAVRRRTPAAPISLAAARRQANESCTRRGVFVYATDAPERA